MSQCKYPQFLINPKERVDPKDPESPLKATRGGPLVLRWWNDPAYRRWEEAKALTARWELSQRLAPAVQEWLDLHGITAYQEFRAAGWRNDKQARESLDSFLLDTVGIF